MLWRGRIDLLRRGKIRIGLASMALRRAIDALS
jgi:hypothetical protein